MADQINKPYRSPAARSEEPQPVISGPPRRWTMRETLVCFLLVAIIVTGYFTVGRFQFVFFDDPGYLSDNLNVLRGLPLFRSPDRDRKPEDPPLTNEERAAIRHKNVEDFKTSVYWAFTAFEQSNWHPLTWLSHMLDIELYGQQWTGGHHITNIILHALNTLLLFGLFWRMTGMTWRSAAVAAMFAVHPMHVESVAWVAERKDVLSTFFGFLTLHAYVTYGRHARFNGATILVATVLAAIIAMLGGLWYYQCFWYLQQVNFFQLHQRLMPPNPQGYEALALTGPYIGVFAVMLILGLLSAAGFAGSTGRTRLLKTCAVWLIFVLVGMAFFIGLCSLPAFEGGQARTWTNGLGAALLLVALAGGTVAAARRSISLALQCGIFVVCVAFLLLALNWIQLPAPQSPAQPAWYNNPFQTAVERIWCTEFVLAIFVITGGLAVDAVWGRRSNLGLFFIVLVLYVLGLLAKPMLVTLPLVMLLIDYWPLERIDLRPHDEKKPAVPVADAARISRLRARQRRRQPAASRQVPVGKPTAAVVVQPLPGTSIAPLHRTAQRALLLVWEKTPLFALAAISCMLTPIAQSHGGSMASPNDLPIAFRLQNATQSYMAYIGRMIWPGKMMSLHLLLSNEKGPYVELKWFLLGLYVVAMLTAVAGLAYFYNRRYIVFGWLWYVGTLVPVIGFVQVGEQAMADRYTYIPYVGLFVAIVWTIGELLDRFSRWRRPLAFATAAATAFILTVWICWTNYQIQNWRGVEPHLVHALEVEPNNWNMLNNYGVYLWKQGQEQERLAAEAETLGNAARANECRTKMKAFKDKAMAQWLHGIESRPTATDIDSNLGYAYSERATQAASPEESKRNLDLAYKYLLDAVRLKEISPRPHNNLGRVLLRQSQQLGAEALAAEEKAKTDPAEAAKIKPLKEQAKLKQDLAIVQFERSIQLEPTLLEARLNLGEVYTLLGNYGKATENYLEMLKLDAPSVVDKDAIANFSQAYFGLARIAIAQNEFDKAVQLLKRSIARNASNMLAIRFLAIECYKRGDYRDGDQGVWHWLINLPAGARRQFAEDFGKQFLMNGKATTQTIHAWGTIAWIFATSPEPTLRDPPKAAELADRIVKATGEQDPLALDTLAAAAAATGQFEIAVRAAQQAINLANSQGNKPLAEAIAPRLAKYQRQTPYLSKPDGSDRP